MRTESEKLQERNAKANRLGRQLQSTVGSPFRIKEIVDGKAPAPTDTMRTETITERLDRFNGKPDHGDECQCADCAKFAPPTRAAERPVDVLSRNWNEEAYATLLRQKRELASALRECVSVLEVSEIRLRGVTPNVLANARAALNAAVGEGEGGR